jgi:hypothetical protein
MIMFFMQKLKCGLAELVGQGAGNFVLDGG